MMGRFGKKGRYSCFGFLAVLVLLLPYVMARVVQGNPGKRGGQLMKRFLFLSFILLRLHMGQRAALFISLTHVHHPAANSGGFEVTRIREVSPQNEGVLENFEAYWLTYDF
ncbi:netrin receptor UNC5D-like protein [Labeo rohita]|uniref:Netrin receptor UNC5D-like protein n=1 Tax=Labeo rohita TaxID=84645 RepID=A0A498NKD8_LABRO|nr:netrin receptor UNC5D-like protein [Labeo rohita]